MQNNSVAQYKIYNLYAKAMLNVAYRFCTNEADAEDILQEAFVSAFKNIKSFKGTASFGAWLKRIVINTALNHLKTKKIAFEEIKDSMEPVNEPEIDFEKDELSIQRIQEAMKRLPQGYRTVLTLYLFEGYDHNEIAEILGVSVSTSKSQYNRAKRKLKEFLNEQIYEQGYGG